LSKRTLPDSAILWSSIELLSGSGHHILLGGNAMSDSIYASNAGDASKDFEWPSNNLTIACALDGKKLTKFVYPSGERAYDNAYYYKFFSREVADLHDLLGYVKLLLGKPDCCLIRGVPKDDSRSRQRRLFHGDDATVIEQDQNWFALDIDGFGVSSGDLKRDAKDVLLALDLPNVEAIAIPSAGYLRKPGIRIRLFLWNHVKVNCISLKKHFEKYKSVVDLALFHPIQPIYTARPVFSGCADPCVGRLWTWITGARMYSEVRKVITDNYGQEYHPTTVKGAIASRNKVIREMQYVEDGDRHNWLYKKTIWIAKYCIDGLLDEDETKDELAAAAFMWWRGNANNDRKTINSAFKDALAAMPTGEMNSGQF
jgi:hypothetical protein